MAGRFDYVKYDELAQKIQAEFKGTVEHLANEIETMLPASPEKILALRQLEVTYMWLGKAIRNDQVNRGGDATDQPARGE